MLEVQPQQEVTDAMITMAVQVSLVGAARSNELQWKNMDLATREQTLKVMKAEWDKWVLFSATKFVSAEEYAKLEARGARAIGTRWVLTREEMGT